MTLLTANKLQVLHCLTKNARVCADLKYINKVFLLPMLEMIPNSPNYLVGLMNIAGKSIPVIDLAIRLGLSRNKNYALDTPILLCNQDDHQVGVIVDKIVGLAEIEEQDIQMHSEFTEESPFIAAITTGTELSLLIDMQKILAISMTFDKTNYSFNTNLNNLAQEQYE